MAESELMMRILKPYIVQNWLYTPVILMVEPLNDFDNRSSARLGSEELLPTTSIKTWKFHINSNRLCARNRFSRLFEQDLQYRDEIWRGLFEIMLSDKIAQDAMLKVIQRPDKHHMQLGCNIIDTSPAELEAVLTLYTYDRWK